MCSTCLVFSCQSTCSSTLHFAFILFQRLLDASTDPAPVQHKKPPRSWTPTFVPIAKHQASAPSMPIPIPDKVMCVTVLLTFNASARTCGQTRRKAMANLRSYNAIYEGMQPFPLFSDHVMSTASWGNPNNIKFECNMHWKSNSIAWKFRSEAIQCHQKGPAELNQREQLRMCLWLEILETEVYWYVASSITPSPKATNWWSKRSNQRVRHKMSWQREAHAGTISQFAQD